MKIELESLGIIKKREDMLTEKDLEHMDRLNREGYSFREIADAYERNYGTVTRYIKEYRKGVVINERMDVQSFDYGKLKALIRAGWNNRWLENEFKIGANELARRKKELIELESC